MIKTCKDKKCRNKKEFFDIFEREDGLYEVRILGGEKNTATIVLTKDDIQQELDNPRKDKEILGE